MKFKTNSFKKQHLITIFDDTFSVTFSTLGASIVQIKYKNDNLIYSPKETSNLAKPDFYYGKTIGPIANRVENGLVQIDGNNYFMSINEGSNSLHSGKDGLSHKYFDYVIDEDNYLVEFYYKKIDLEDGLPGNIIYKVTYAIKHMQIKLNFQVVSDKNTMISLTNHTYFCLKDKDINNLFLTTSCDRYVAVNESTLIPKEIKKVPEYLDFNTRKNIGDTIKKVRCSNKEYIGHDYDLIFKNKKPNNSIVLEDSSYILEIETDFPGFQFYTDNHENPYDFLDISLKKWGSVAIEPCDTILDRKILKASQKYERKIIYRFKEK